jgi:hypothetical protein
MAASPLQHEIRVYPIIEPMHSFLESPMFTVLLCLVAVAGVVASGYVTSKKLDELY